MVVQSQLSNVCRTSILYRDVTMVAESIPVVLHDERLVADVACLRVTFRFASYIGSNDGERLKVAFLCLSPSCVFLVESTIDETLDISTTRSLSDESLLHSCGLCNLVSSLQCVCA